MDEMKKVQNQYDPDFKRKNLSPALRAYTKFQERHGDPHPGYSLYYINEIRQNISFDQDMLYRHPESLPPFPGETQFLKDALLLDGSFSKAGHGYWSENCELLARAGACYIKDKCEELGIRNDYLSGHAERSGVPVTGGKTVHTYPLGEDRENINKVFDEFLEDMRLRGIFRTNEEEKTVSMPLDQNIQKSAEIATERQIPKVSTEKEER